MSDERYELLYQEALRSVRDQPGAIDSIQSRAGLVGSAAAVGLSLASVQGSLGTAWAWGILPVFVGTFLAIAWILWPRGTWRFDFEPDVVLWQYIEGPKPLRTELMKRDLALHLGRYAQINAEQIDRLARMLAGALVGLLVESVLIVLSFL